MSFYNGILNLTNWAGNVIMPTLGALFIAFAVIQFARGYHHLYSAWAYGGLMCLMVSGLLRMFEKFTGQLGWNNRELSAGVRKSEAVASCHPIMPVGDSFGGRVVRINSRQL